MTQAFRIFAHLKDDIRGATLLEFAFISPVLFTILLGLTDFGYRCYAAAIVEGTLQQAARLATIGNKTEPQIDSFVRAKLINFNSGATVTVTKTNYYKFANVKRAETLTSDANSNGSWNTGDCYVDLNGNGKWDSISGVDGLGGSDDIVYYKVDFEFDRLVPLGKFLGWSNRQLISANTVMRNQPYGSQATPNTICTSA
jgi:hypothetical protein